MNGIIDDNRFMRVYLEHQYEKQLSRGLITPVNDRFACLKGDNHLRNACIKGNYKIIKLLIKKRTTINLSEYLKIACLNLDYHIVKYMLKFLPKTINPHISLNTYTKNIWKIFNTYNPLIYKLDGSIKYLPNIITLNSSLFIGII